MHACSGNAGRTIKEPVALSITLERPLVAIAEVARPHGIKGELRLKVYNPETPLIAAGRRMILRTAEDGSRDRTVRLLTVRSTTQAVLVQLEGIVDRDQAEGLRGAKLCVPREELPVLDPGEFYAYDVEGARAELVTGELVGTVKTLVSYPTCEVLVVVTPEGKTLEIPLVDDVVAEVDGARRLVRLKSAEPL